MISIIVPVRNGLPWVEDQLHAIAAQGNDHDWELLVVDNGSTDGTAAVVDAFVEAHPWSRRVDGAGLAGAAAARNVGARAARGDLLAFCDADDVARPSWVAACVDALGSADIVAGVFDFTTLNGLAPAPATAASNEQLPFLPFGLSANLAVHRVAFEAVGGFDEALVTGEDVDLCWRLQLAGYRFALAPDAVVAKRDRAGFTQVFTQAMAYGRGAPVLYRRHRQSGATRNLRGAARSWLWLVAHLPQVATSGPQRNQWARGAGMRVGRLVGSAHDRVFFP